MSLRDRIQRDDIESIGAYLDSLSARQRLLETRALTRDDQRELFRKAESHRALTLEDFVGAGVPPLTEVIHDGRNTLPLPASLRLFQKRFCRPASGEGRLFGYNQSPFLGTVGPGFFVAVHTAESPAWEARGAVVVDYFQVPDAPVVKTWPAVVPNTKGLQRFVYHRTRDFMRGVSAHVTIGAAYKVEKALDHYFVLCRAE